MMASLYFTTSPSPLEISRFATSKVKGKVGPPQPVLIQMMRSAALSCLCPISPCPRALVQAETEALGELVSQQQETKVR